MPGITLPTGQRPPGEPGLLSPVFRLGDAVVLLDQRRLPQEELWTAYEDWRDVARAIREMEVRGAPAIGCAAAFAAALAWQQTRASDAGFTVALKELAATRPTAVNLQAALDRMASVAKAGGDVLDAAQAFWREDVAACRQIGRLGAEFIPDGATVLTHCNAGGLATAGYGTALGVIRAAVESGKKVRVLCDETRPWLQGARLTAWELLQDGIPAEVIVDGAAAHFLARGEVAAVVTGADRIARNGDVANKIGTLGVAAAAFAFGVPFYVAAPTTTLDAHCPEGAAIPIESRAQAEVAEWHGRRVIPIGVGARNPVFDVTPARFVTAIVTESGIARPPYDFGTT